MSTEEPKTDDASVSRDDVRAKAKKVNARIRGRKIAKRIVITVVIVAAVAAAAWWVWRTVAPELERDVVTPQNVTNDGIDVLGLLPEDERPATVDDPIELEIYMDYMSPDAGDIGTELLPQIYDLLDEGVVTLDVHPVSLLAGQSNGTQYSTRAAGAVMCVVSGAPEAFRDVNQVLLTEQPQLSTEGYTDEELAQIAADAGAEGVNSCIMERKYASWVSDATDRAADGALLGTEGVQLGEALVLVDGELYDGSLADAGEFTQFLLTLQSEEYFGGKTEEESQ
ncbi:MAG TPA: thioredoxin domain-containing protein [Candidatus Microbacterium stercoravium]|uniref:Thioredoxin domain-containing protein n=1 Tax=Candidatus Microbacterium stercoravium TaxID=2838697 RepID=A0A9D2H6D2_9MICO|nr:thioredoxin domain-containing protein [Candidatus Microbacterium stercoravium]